MMEPRGVRPYGASGLADGSVRWYVWAPRSRHIELILHTGGGRAGHPLV
jgi:hypothetical protein